MGIFLDDGFGVKCNPQTGDAEHWQIIGTVADGNGLLQTDVFDRGDGFENFSFSPTVDDVTGDLARYFTVFDFKQIGKNVVQVQTFLQGFTEVVKAAGYDAALVAKLLQGTGQNSSIHRSGKSQKTRCLGRNLQCIGYGGYKSGYKSATNLSKRVFTVEYS